MRALARALPLEPENLAIEEQLLRLGRELNAWAEVASALREAAIAAMPSPARAAELRIKQGEILERELADYPGALEAYHAAAELRGSDPERLEAVVRVGARAGEWDVACTAAAASVRLRDRIEPELLPTLEEVAETAGAWRPLAEAMDRASLAVADSLPTKLAATLEARLAGWYREKCEDVDASNRALRRALEHDPSDKTALEQLAAMQRAAPGAELVATLLKLDDAEERSLDPLAEAAEVALGSTKDAKLARSTLERLYAKAKRLWNLGEGATGEKQPAPTTGWAVDRSVELYVKAGVPRLAIDLLVEAASLPVEPDRAGELRRRAAEMMLEQGDRVRAIETYRAALHLMPEDIVLIRRLAELCEQEEHETGSVALRRREVELTEDAAARLELRLANARSAAGLEKRSGRVDLLLGNLEQELGHEPSIEALVEVLTERGRFADLARVLEEQAQQLEARGEPAPAARLYGRMAVVAEQQLRDVARVHRRLGQGGRARRHQRGARRAGPPALGARTSRPRPPNGWSGGSRPLGRRSAWPCC